MYISVADMLRSIVSKEKKEKPAKEPAVKHHVLKQLGLRPKDVPLRKPKDKGPKLYRERGRVKFEK